MADTADIDEEDKPLDPAVERVRRKLMALMLVSMGTFGIGLVALIAVIGWRVMRTSGPELAADIALPVPAGDLVAVSGSGDELVLTIGGAEPRIEVRSRADGALLQTFRLAP